MAAAAAAGLAEVSTANLYKVVGDSLDKMGIVFSALVFVGQHVSAFLLGLVGFSSTGPVAGTWAAALMAFLAKGAGGAIGGGSCYAFLQSLAMGGAAAPVTAILGAVYSGIAGACGYAVAKFM